MKTRTRFAPSPTGYLHIGGLRTALFNYLLSKKNNGNFILRIEDTDRNRLVEGAVNNLINTLNIEGINPDEGVLKDEEEGKYKPYAENGDILEDQSTSNSFTYKIAQILSFRWKVKVIGKYISKTKDIFNK